jgi:hypothetical protein
MEKISLKKRISIEPSERGWLNEQAIKYHYMHRGVHPRASPFGWSVKFDENLYQSDGQPSGFIIFASIHFTKLKGQFGYPGLPTKWQVLSLSRLWLHDNLPRNSETVVIAKALKLVQDRWLEVHPPKNLSEPYQICKIISYADTRYHIGTIYRAANFTEIKRTKSARRHKNTRGTGMDGAELICFVYDLKEKNNQF